MTVVEPSPATAAPAPTAGRARAPRVPIDWQAVWAVVNFATAHERDRFLARAGQLAD